MEYPDQDQQPEKYRPYVIPAGDTVIWRYMDFVKYVSMLNNGSLFFTHPDKFSDPFEGAVGYASTEEEYYNTSGSDGSHSAKHNPDLDRVVKRMRKQALEVKRSSTYINCWYENPNESEAMWRLYSTDNYNAIAIKTTCRKLYDSLKKCSDDQRYLSDFKIGQVIYTDYKGWVYHENAFWYKRDSFSHEREVRAIYYPSYFFPEMADDDGLASFNAMLEDRKKPGLHVPVDLSILIEKVVVSPLAAPWLIALVKDVSNKYGLEVEVIESYIAQKPFR
ncbi:hypothetical protein KBK19_14175 [Microvirga sp. STR05]|uniref:DUF2971 domain-containing protein n=1 Tax=Hymenobacter duratus TaxID=2771356 RepID=A0ABR8JLB7_9BACT|nr:DUF2971 domain-containing protein [Hymenobacter duratus]MBD2716185.1 hypothetical protein [Hymenobacter duratus]MBR7951099.1 hypothetical protein [Microvirga sp. STR05]